MWSEREGTVATWCVTVTREPCGRAPPGHRTMVPKDRARVESCAAADSTGSDAGDEGDGGNTHAHLFPSSALSLAWLCLESTVVPNGNLGAICDWRAGP